MNRLIHPSTRRLPLILALLAATAVSSACQTDSEPGVTSNATERRTDADVAHHASEQQRADAAPSAADGGSGPSADGNAAAAPHVDTQPFVSTSNADATDAHSDPTVGPEPDVNSELVPANASDAGPGAGHVPQTTDDAPLPPANDSDQDSGLVEAGLRSVTYVEGSCVGDALTYADEAQPCSDDVGQDAGACAQHRPCNGWGEEHECSAEPGCTWELREIVDEGTETGKSCTGTPYPCERTIGECIQGCDEVRRQGKYGWTLSCEGTPTACAQFDHSEACKLHVGCTWK